MPLGRGEDPPRTGTAWIAPYYFSLLRVGPPALGRYLTDEECRVPTNEHVAVIGCEEWKGRYGATRRWSAGPLSSRAGCSRSSVSPLEDSAASTLTPCPIGCPSVPYSWPYQPPWYQDRRHISVRMLVRTSQPRAQLEGVVTAAFRAGAPTREQTQSNRDRPRHRGQRSRRRDERRGTCGEACRRRVAGAVHRVCECRRPPSVKIGIAAQGRLPCASPSGMSGTGRRACSCREPRCFLAAGVASLFVAQVGGEALRRTLMPDVVWAGALIDGRLTIFAIAVSFPSQPPGLPAVLSAQRGESPA